jgi:hypothetical protein
MPGPALVSFTAPPALLTIGMLMKTSSVGWRTVTISSLPAVVPAVRAPLRSPVPLIW